MHLPYAGNVFLLILRAVEDSRTGFEMPAVNANKIQVAVLVGNNLEYQRRKRLIDVGFASEFLITLEALMAFDGRNIQRAWQVGNDCVEILRRDGIFKCLRQ